MVRGVVLTQLSDQGIGNLMAHADQVNLRCFCGSGHFHRERLGRNHLNMLTAAKGRTHCQESQCANDWFFHVTLSGLLGRTVPWTVSCAKSPPTKRQKDSVKQGNRPR
uniref:Uncharacterized protein n=1 Tax=Magnetococcus massalia (strain MO-1) TaxID=451514 RepID=A0A1S7LH85_MAGMO|nr:protein of unknown function [Candidatus Magnetococcus massalia]